MASIREIAAGDPESSKVVDEDDDEMAFIDDRSDNEDGPWEDVTALLASAASELCVGEMIHPANFSLYSAMSAIELMQPKMDVGFGAVRNVEDVEIPETLTDSDVIRIIDELLACQATWMESHTLPQTVFSCVYVQRLAEVPRPELAAFIRVQLASMSIIRTLVTTEQVSDEEDFVSYNYGFKLPVMSEPTVAKLVRDATSTLMGSSPGESNANASGKKQLLCARLKFMQLFHTTLSALAAPKCKRVSQAEIAIELAAVQLKLIRESWAMYPDDPIAHCFDSTFNRHLLSNAPPRTAPILDRENAFEAWSNLLDQLRALTTLKNRILPEARRRHTPLSSQGDDANETDEYTPFFSFHALCHGLSEFSATWNPCIVTRSLLKRMLMPSMRDQVPIYSVEEAVLGNLLLCDIGLTREGANETLRKEADDLAAAAAHILWNLLRNRGRQRRCLLQSLTEWDRCVLLHTSSRDPEIDALTDDADSSEEMQERNRPKDMFAGRSPMQLLAHEVLTRVMMQHWLLGFECNLYNPKEYAPIFFYIGYVMTTAANATVALANVGLSNAELHPCRYALYLLDEARLWLCRGTFSVLEALELGPNWNYSWRRRRRRWVPSTVDGGIDILEGSEQKGLGDVELTNDDDDDTAGFESESLWYQQRFGVMSRLSTGPHFMDYRTFLTLMDLQRDALLRTSEAGSDEIDVRLADASGGYRMVRDALKRAKTVAESFNWEPVLDEALALTRVAVSNMVAINQLQKSKAATDGAVKALDVTFSFTVHRHFPVVKVV